MNTPMKLINIITHFFKTIFTWKTIFTQITFTLTLPLAIIFAAHTFIPNILKNPHQTFTFTFTDSVFDLIIFTYLFTFYHFLTIWFTTYANSNSNNNINNILLNVKPTKLALNIILRLILTFMFVYFGTLFSNNLMVAILGLTDTIVFTIFIMWYAIFHMYFMGLLLLLSVVQLDMIKHLLGDKGKGLKAIVPKVLGGYLVNVLVMTPLIRNVAEEMVAPMWDVIIRGLLGVLFLPTVVFQVVHFKKFTRELPAAN